MKKTKIVFNRQSTSDTASKESAGIMVCTRARKETSKTHSFKFSGGKGAPAPAAKAAAPQRASTYAPPPRVVPRAAAHTIRPSAGVKCSVSGAAAYEKAFAIYATAKAGLGDASPAQACRAFASLVARYLPGRP